MIEGSWAMHTSLQMVLVYFCTKSERRTNMDLQRGNFVDGLGRMVKKKESKTSHVTSLRRDLVGDL